MNRSPISFNDYIPNSLKAINSNFRRSDSKQTFSNSLINTKLNRQKSTAPYSQYSNTIDANKQFKQEMFHSIF